MNITDYLLLPEQAKWAEKMGFNGSCNYTSMAFQKVPKKNSELNISFTIPTFDAFFDWVEEKWGILVQLYNDFCGMWDCSVDKMPTDSKGCVEMIFQYSYKDKRDARIAAVEAIIKYINENEL